MYFFGVARKWRKYTNGLLCLNLLAYIHQKATTETDHSHQIEMQPKLRSKEIRKPTQYKYYSVFSCCIIVCGAAGADYWLAE